MKKINKIRIIKTISVLSSTSILLSSIFLMTGGCKPSTENTKTESEKQESKSTEKTGKDSKVAQESKTESDSTVKNSQEKSKDIKKTPQPNQKNNEVIEFLRNKNGEKLSSLDSSTFEFSSDDDNNLQFKLKNQETTWQKLNHYKVIGLDKIIVKTDLVLTGKALEEVIKLLKEKNGKLLSSITTTIFEFSQNSSHQLLVKLKETDQPWKIINNYKVIDYSKILVKIDTPLVGKALEKAKSLLTNQNGKLLSSIEQTTFTFSKGSENKIFVRLNSESNQPLQEIDGWLIIKNKLVNLKTRITEVQAIDSLEELEKKIGQPISNTEIITTNYTFKVEDNKVTKVKYKLQTEDSYFLEINKLKQNYFIVNGKLIKRTKLEKQPITNEQKPTINGVLNSLKTLPSFSITKEKPLSDVNTPYKDGISINEYIKKIENYFENLYTLKHTKNNIEYTFTINLFGEITTCKYNNTLIDIKDFSKNLIIIFIEKETESINYKTAKLYNLNDQSKKAKIDQFKLYITNRKKDYLKKINLAKTKDNSKKDEIKQIINGIESAFQSSYDLFVENENFND